MFPKNFLLLTLVIQIFHQSHRVSGRVITYEEISLSEDLTVKFVFKRDPSLKDFGKLEIILAQDENKHVLRSTQENEIEFAKKIMAYAPKIEVPIIEDRTITRAVKCAKGRKKVNGICSVHRLVHRVIPIPTKP